MGRPILHPWGVPRDDMLTRFPWDVLLFWTEPLDDPPGDRHPTHNGIVVHPIVRLRPTGRHTSRPMGYIPWDVFRPVGRTTSNVP